MVRPQTVEDASCGVAYLRKPLAIPHDPRFRPKDVTITFSDRLSSVPSTSIIDASAAHISIHPTSSSSLSAHFDAQSSESSSESNIDDDDNVSHLVRRSAVRRTSGTPSLFQYLPPLEHEETSDSESEAESFSYQYTGPVGVTFEDTQCDEEGRDSENVEESTQESVSTDAGETDSFERSDWQSFVQDRIERRTGIYLNEQQTPSSFRFRNRFARLVYNINRNMELQTQVKRRREDDDEELGR
ncbi:hypothetical protein HK098_002349 [Nowakowskiella sp. JEL0407]|nr:hypothetical protein HK098_002349 [Nowakowskiella sp. JEL0407]